MALPSIVFSPIWRAGVIPFIPLKTTTLFYSEQQLFISLPNQPFASLFQQIQHGSHLRPRLVVGIEGLLMIDHCIGNVEQFASTRTASDFHRLACCTQPLIVGFDGRVKASGCQGGNIQLCASACMPTVPNLRTTMDARAAPAHHGSQADIVNRSFGGLTQGKVERGDHQPACREQSDTWNSQ